MPLLDPPLTPLPKIKLSRLRDIGWSKWDPLGLLGDDQKWYDEACRPFADEYDSYLLQAAGQLRRGVPEDTVAHYLVDIEVDHMCLGTAPRALARAKKMLLRLFKWTKSFGRIRASLCKRPLLRLSATERTWASGACDWTTPA